MFKNWRKITWHIGTLKTKILWLIYQRIKEIFQPIGRQQNQWFWWSKNFREIVVFEKKSSSKNRIFRWFLSKYDWLKILKSNWLILDVQLSFVTMICLQVSLEHPNFIPTNGSIPVIIVRSVALFGPSGASCLLYLLVRYRDTATTKISFQDVVHPGISDLTIFLGDVPYADDESIRFNRRRPISVPISPDCLTAINRMLDIHPESRIRLDQIMDLNFFDKSETFDISTNQILPFNIPTQSLTNLTEVAPPR